MTTTPQANPAPPRHSDGPAPAFPWSSLQAGDSVSLRGNKGVVVEGKVEIVSEDGSALWIWTDHGWSRRLIHQDEGYELVDVRFRGSALECRPCRTLTASDEFSGFIVEIP